jgi:hypothetical protein
MAVTFPILPPSFRFAVFHFPVTADAEHHGPPFFRGLNFQVSINALSFVVSVGFGELSANFQFNYTPFLSK